MNRFLVCALLAAPLLTLAGEVSAQTRNGSLTIGPGNRYAGAKNVYSVAANVGATTANTTVTAVGRARLLSYAYEVNRVTFTSRHDGNNRARVVFMGRTIRDEALPNGQPRTMPSTFSPAFSASMGFDLGVVGVELRAQAGGGNQYTAVARNRAGGNPAAHLSGPSQSWVIGVGSATLRILWGAASARGEVALEGLNATTAMTLPTERSTVSTRNMTCPVDQLDWRFYVRIRAYVLGIEVADTKPVDVRGTRTVRNILN